MMDSSATTFFKKSCKGYAKAKCSKCKYRTNKAMLVSFRFFKRNGTRTYEFWNTRHKALVKDRFTIQDGHLVCQKCCGYNKRATASMEGHAYTWIDGSMSYCPKGQFTINKPAECQMKTLTQCVFEGNFTRETLRKVMTYDHESWEMPLNQYIRKHAADWDKVKKFATLLQQQQLK